ncbi:hypothetical protein HYPSUDRAFT_38425 [Hypholoma sublateritium FD-334 SS-4]|uniref:Uncharacterized protein n=1 Tax=Hypholoma sublateritium (strain FD-334 SS-4) TaxID=945553 RepID=A0A0D2P808_HYPSF|nr:hypothetical protein HYPSUDRAFT_38425 [Hypholoma sublateritium FD-334 SS-4]
MYETSATSANARWKSHGSKRRWKLSASYTRSSMVFPPFHRAIDCHQSGIEWPHSWGSLHAIPRDFHAIHLPVTTWGIYSSVLCLIRDAFPHTPLLMTP